MADVGDVGLSTGTRRGIDVDTTGVEKEKNGTDSKKGKISRNEVLP